MKIPMKSAKICDLPNNWNLRQERRQDQEFPEMKERQERRQDQELPKMEERTPEQRQLAARKEWSTIYGAKYP